MHSLDFLSGQRIFRHHIFKEYLQLSQQHVRGSGSAACEGGELEGQTSPRKCVWGLLPGKLPPLWLLISKLHLWLRMRDAGSHACCCGNRIVLSAGSV